MPTPIGRRRFSWCGHLPRVTTEFLLNKNVIMGAIAVVALGVAVFLMLNRGGANNEDPAESMSQRQVWVCADCKAETAMTKREYLDSLNNQTFGCSGCRGTNLQSALYCTVPTCGKAIPTIGHGRLPNSCPHCGTVFGQWENQENSHGVTPPPG